MACPIPQGGHNKQKQDQEGINKLLSQQPHIIINAKQRQT